MKWYYLLLALSTLVSSIIGMETKPPKATPGDIKKLYHFIEQDFTQLLKQLLTDCEFSRREKSEALLNAVQSRKINCVGILLSHGANVNGGNLNKQTPLLEAVLGRQVTATRWLLIHGADPERRSLLTDFDNIPSVLQGEGSDSDDVYITPLALAQARLQSRIDNKVDVTIYNMLSKPSQSWNDESLKGDIKVYTTSCLEAIKHSDHHALSEYLKNCKHTNQMRKKYLNDRLKLAAQMGDLEAMRILIGEGAGQDCVFQAAVNNFDHIAITSFVVKQYVDDLQIQKAIKRTRESSYDSHSPATSLRKFNKKKQKTLDLLSDSRILVINALTQDQNIALSLQQRETTGII